MIRMKLLSILILLCPLLAHEALIHTNEFAVYIPGPIDLADQIANKYGFINKGQVGSLEGYYRFEHYKIQKRSISPSTYHASLLQNDSMVHWYQQQVAKKRVKRSAIPEEFPEFSDPLYPEQWFLHAAEPGHYDMNVRPAWARGYTGKGVVVSILDDGIQGNHPDLALNYDKEASLDINDSDDDPSPKDNDDNKHGTRCAGEVAAVANNEFCGVGIAYNARIGGVRMLDGSVTDTIEATALSLKPNHIHIYSASWGPEDDGKTVDGPGPLAKIAFEDGIRKGRNGLGSIYVWASGNGGKQNDNCNCDGYTNSVYTISISSATESGYKPWYLEECSSTLATTYSSGTVSSDRNIVTVDVNYAYFEELKSENRPNLSRLCTKKHTGTSASAPIAAALCALALEANPKLTWRDMQYIIVITSRHIPLLKEDGWMTNAANRKVSTKFGYGLMDGDAMVRVAKRWKTLAAQHICSSKSDETVRTIPKRHGDFLEAVIYADGCENTKNFVKYAEHVQVRVTLSFHPRGNLHIILVSPKNTTSSLLFPRLHDTVMNQDSFNDWPFMSVHFWGEEVQGQWKLIIRNAGKNSADYSGSLTNWSITFYGTEDLPTCVKNNHCMEEENEKQRDTTHTFPIRDINTPTEMSVEECKTKNKFLIMSEDSTKYCVSECPPSFYGSTKDYKCQKCDGSCYSCFGPSYNNCHLCPPLSYLHNYTCIKHCPRGYFTDIISGITSGTKIISKDFQQCVPCASSCSACDGNMYKCVKCKEDFYLFKHQCIPYCPAGTYTSDNKCELCSPECKFCYGPLQSNCLSCSPGFYLMDQSCLSQCPKKYFVDGKGRCVACHRSCEKCDSQSYCITCDDKYKQSELQGQCEMNICDTTKGHIRNCHMLMTCQNSLCKFCTEEEDYCDLCDKSYWFQGDCYSDCPVSTYIFRDECRKCEGKCFSCTGNPYECTICHDDFYLYEALSLCLPSCPYGLYGSRQRVCEKCHASCKECFGPNEYECIWCPVDRYLHNSNCIASCPSGFFPATYDTNDFEGNQAVKRYGVIEENNVKVCMPCHSSCKTCSDYGPFFCTSCHPDRALINNNCIPCLDGSFYNYREKKCEKCDDHCGKCYGPSANQCLSCFAPLRLHKIQHICLPCCLPGAKDSCCNCTNELDTCIIANPSVKNFTVIPGNKTFSQQIATAAVVVSVVVVVLFIILFLILQYRSSEAWHHSFRGKQYIPVPRDLSATYNADQEKVCLTQGDMDEEDDIFLKT